MVRPWSSRPLSVVIAFCASAGELISTKPKPRERPVSRSVITAADSQWPHSANSASRSAFVVLKDRLPTKIFLPMLHSRPSWACWYFVSVAWARRPIVRIDGGRSPTNKGTVADISHRRVTQPGHRRVRFAGTAARAAGRRGRALAGGGAAGLLAGVSSTRFGGT